MFGRVLIFVCWVLVLGAGDSGVDGNEGDVMQHAWDAKRRGPPPIPPPSESAGRGPMAPMAGVGSFTTSWEQSTSWDPRKSFFFEGTIGVLVPSECPLSTVGVSSSTFGVPS